MREGMGQRLLTAAEKVWRLLFRYQQEVFWCSRSGTLPTRLPTLNIKRKLIGSKTLQQIECHYGNIG